MPALLHVSRIRRELDRAAGFADGAGDGDSSTPLLGRMFHEVVAELVSGDGRNGAAAALADSESDQAGWQADLQHHAWRRLAGPRLARNQAMLHESSREAIAFWKAVEEACDWLGELLWTMAEERRDSLHRARKTPPDLSDWMVAEQELTWELRAPGWSDAVRLTGVADVVLRIPDRGHWCVVELKLGRTSPEVDLGQACLYHRMLAASTGDSPDSALAVVGFAPQRRERLFAATELAAAQDRLIDVIGRLAGVATERAAAGVAQQRKEQLEVEPATSRPAAAIRSSVVSPASREQSEQGRMLIETFREYGAAVEPDGEPIVGPTFIRYPVLLGRGVRLGAVKGRAVEVRMRLGLPAPPVIGLSEQGQVVIDVQRPDRRFIRFADIRDQLPAGDPLHGSSRVPLGVDLDGRLQFADLSQTEHAHLLAAGTTGSGKSEWLRSAIAGLVVTNTPETLRLVLIDPKRNAFHALRESPFLYEPIVHGDDEPVSAVLRRLVEEMEARYARLDGADSLDQHIARTAAALPRIVCVCDEYADLLGRGREEKQMLEEQITRLGAKARAAGIHLILATQQPSRGIIKGTLDANIPARVGLKMQNPIESRMLLNESGAENLLGLGDLLFRDIGPLRRLQSAWLPPEEREAVFGGMSP